MKSWKLMLCMSLLSAVLLSLPWLVPHAGAASLIGFIPLLCADAYVDRYEEKGFWKYIYLTFLLWNAATTFWVCGATVGGGIFAVMANAFQMMLVWLLFRFSKKHLSGILPYVFLASAWMAWEWLYYYVDISWPWLTLGNAFARSTRSIQWYEFTGVMGGSLWIWAVNLTLYGVLVAFTGGIARKWNQAVTAAVVLGTTLLVCGPLALSNHIYRNYEQASEGALDFVIGQPNIDPYNKFQAMSQAQQNARLLSQFDSVLVKGQYKDTSVLLLAPETFTSDVVLGSVSPTMQAFSDFLVRYPNAGLLFGASTYDIDESRSAPSALARPYGDGWIRSHNSAILLADGADAQIYHKSRLVVAVESTPYPRIFVPLDNWLSKLLGEAGLMGRCEGQDEVSLLDFAGIPLGSAICYESIYGDYCRGYANKGAKALVVITNDAWWGDTPGYRQHLSYACLRAIELRRDIARCGNTGISCFIDQRGDVISRTRWWTQEVLCGSVDLNSAQTFYAKHGDIAGMVGAAVFAFMLVLLIVRALFFRASSR